MAYLFMWKKSFEIFKIYTNGAIGYARAVFRNTVSGLDELVDRVSYTILK